MTVEAAWVIGSFIAGFFSFGWGCHVGKKFGYWRGYKRGYDRGYDDCAEQVPRILTALSGNGPAQDALLDGDPHRAARLIAVDVDKLKERKI